MDYKSAILKKLKKVEDLPTLPTVAMEVNRLLMDVNTSVKELSDTIRKDQAMVPKILKLVNSAFYGFPSRIASVDRAIVLLGYNTVRNAVLSVSVMEAFGKDKDLAGFNLSDFWIHAITVAVVSRHLAATSRLHAPEDAFTAGLIHDIGKILLIKYFPDAFVALCSRVEEGKESFFEAETDLLKIAHTRMGATLAKRWKFPDEIVDAIRNHHFYGESDEDIPGLRAIVRASNLVAKTTLGGTLCASESESFSRDVAYFARFIDIGQEMNETVRKEVEDACDFFIGGDENDG
jgi:putative nucleotidyltransferase with HDIG domain